MKSKKLRALAGAVAVMLPSLALGQVSASWNTDANGNFSGTSNWSPATVPGTGGTATFGMGFGQTSGRTVTQDVVGLTLGGMTFDTAFGYTVSGTNTITLASGGFALTGTSAYSNPPLALVSTSTASIDAPLTGTTTAITKTGPAIVRLNSTTSNFVGSIIINDGGISITNGNNLSLGNAANGVTLNGGTLFVTTNTLNTGRTFTIGANGGLIRNTAIVGLTSSTALAGSGTLTKTNSGALNLSGNAAGFTGSLLLQTGTTTFSGASTLGGSSVVEVAGSTLTFDNASTNVNARLGTRQILSRGGTLNFAGNVAGSAMTFGDLVANQANTFLTVTPAASATGATTVTFSNVVRNNGGSVFFRGTGLGAAPGAGNATIYVTGSVSQFGAGGSPTSSTTASVIPYAHGIAAATGSTGTTFVTRDAGSGQIIPLDTTTGYTTDINASTSSDNVNQAATIAIANSGSPKTVNSLRLAPTASMTISGDPLVLDSGALLSTSATTSPAVPTITISSDLSASSGRELVLNSLSGSVFAGTGLIVNGNIGGTAGLTKVGSGGLTLRNNASAYTGPTIIGAGVVLVGGGTVGVSTPSYFGNSASAITITGGGATSAIFTDGNLVINRDIDIIGGHSTSTGVQIGTAALNPSESVVINGNINVGNPNNSIANGYLTFAADPVASNSVTVNGNITGTGSLRATAGSYNKLTGNNTYSGGTLVGLSNLAFDNATVALNWNGVDADNQGEVWVLGSNTALGTGTVHVYTNTSATNFPQIPAKLVADGANRTLANNLVFAGDAMRVGGSNRLTFTGSVDLNGGVSANGTGPTFHVDAGAELELRGVVGRGTMSKTGAGKLVLSGANTFTGQARLGGSGIVEINSIANGGVPSSIGAAPSSSTVGLQLSGGVTLRYVGATASTNRQIALASNGGTIESSGSGPIAFSNASGTVGSNSLLSTSPTYGAGQTVIPISAASSMLLSPGMVVTNANSTLSAGTTVSFVGPNFFILSSPTIAAGSGTTGQLSFTQPTRVLGLSGTAGTVANPNVMGLIVANSTSASVALTKSGTGVWSLTNANTYPGGTTVNGGTLLINNTTGSGTGTGAVVVNTGGTLGGSGIISGNVTVNTGGTLAAGNSPGVLSIASNLSLDVGSTLAVELTGLTAGTQYDQVRLTGASSTYALLNAGGAPVLSFPTLSGSYVAGDFFAIIRNDVGAPGTGFFAGLPASGSTVAALGSFGGVASWEIYYNANVDSAGALLGTSGGNDVVLLAVPEPTTLGVIGAASLIALRRRSTKRA